MLKCFQGSHNFPLFEIFQAFQNQSIYLLLFKSKIISNLAFMHDGLPDARLSRSMRRGGQLTLPGLTNLHVTRT